jgi:hypothetical protein
MIIYQSVPNSKRRDPLKFRLLLITAVIQKYGSAVLLPVLSPTEL